MTLQEELNVLVGKALEDKYEQIISELKAKAQKGERECYLYGISQVLLDRLTDEGLIITSVDKTTNQVLVTW